MESIVPLRSLLFVPGARPDFLGKAEAARPDAIVLDLEDSVPIQGKGEARAFVGATLQGRTERLTFIRINHPKLGMIEDDLAVLAPHRFQSIIVPKVESVDAVVAVDQGLSVFERKHQLALHAISLVIGIESATGLRALYDALTSTPRGRGAALASAEEGDLMVDLGGRWTPGGEALAYARGKFVCDARASSASWVLDGAFMNLANAEALQREASLARTYGFNGKIAIHPRQVLAINQVFSPTAAEVDRARRLIDAFRAAEAQGRGAVNFEGMMVDYANVRLAEQVVALAQR